MNNLKIVIKLEETELYDSVSKPWMYKVHLISQNRNKNSFQIFVENIIKYSDKFKTSGDYRISVHLFDEIIQKEMS